MRERSHISLTQKKKKKNFTEIEVKSANKLEQLIINDVKKMRKKKRNKI